MKNGLKNTKWIVNLFQILLYNNEGYQIKLNNDDQLIDCLKSILNNNASNNELKIVVCNIFLNLTFSNNENQIKLCNDDQLIDYLKSILEVFKSLCLNYYFFKK